MASNDYEYLCRSIGNMSGIPIRFYREKELLFSYSVIPLPKDPVLLYEKEILEKQDHVSYFVTKRFYYYGTVGNEHSRIILGPTRQMLSSDQEIKELAFQCEVPPQDIDAFVAGMKSIVPMPLETILQILLAMNCVLNDEQLSLSDISVSNSNEGMVFAQVQKDAAQEAFEMENNPPRNSLMVEEAISNIIRHGDMAGLVELTKSIPSVRAGKLASGPLRQLKNTFIVAATLSSRAAIRGGLSPEVALSMSDRYIQHMERLEVLDQIMDLQFRMVADYTEQVARVRVEGAHSKLVSEVSNYIQSHLSEPISTEEMAKSLYLSRSRLSTKFKQQTGMTLTDFILKEKTEEAKRLLRYSDKPMPSISAFLGFSSQSHFSRVFKKYAGITPKEYLDKYR